jgi:hypothetical protein
LSPKRGRQRAPGSTDGRNEAPDHAISQFSSPLVFSTEIWCCVMQAVPILVINFRLPHIQLAEFWFSISRNLAIRMLDCQEVFFGCKCAHQSPRC